jgi:hypothetical protein
VATIRIVEPDPETRTLLEILVTRLGHTLDDTIVPDLLIIEPAGPGAPDIVRELRAHRPELPVVAVTILSPGPELSAVAATRCVQKPVSGRRLSQAIDHALASTDPVQSEAPPR